jgi:hypothetical protein
VIFAKAEFRYQELAEWSTGCAISAIALNEARNVHLVLRDLRVACSAIGRKLSRIFFYLKPDFHSYMEIRSAISGI